jgi:hypothetical protein
MLVPAKSGGSVADMTATTGGLVPTPPNDVTKFLNGIGTFTIPSGASAGGYAEFYNIKIDFGTNNVAGDGVTDDSINWAAAVATGRNIYIPDDCSILTYTGVTLAQGQMIRGSSWIRVTDTGAAGRAPNGGSNIIWGATTGNCISISTEFASNYLSNFSIIQKIGTTPTIGAGISVGDNTNRVYNVRLENVVVNGCYNCFYLFGKINSNVFVNCCAWTYVNAGIYINSAVPYGGGFWMGTYVYGHPTQSTNSVGILCDAFDTCLLSNTVIAGGGKGLWIRGNVRTCYQMTITNLVIENQIGNSPLQLGDGTYGCADCNISGLHIWDNTSNYALVIGPQSIRTTISCGNSTNTHNITDSGVGTKLTDFSSSIGTILLSGSYTKLRGVTTPNLTISATATYLDVQGNTFTNAPSISSVVWATSIIKNNIGLADILTSISSTPLYKGQISIVTGSIYMAVATSSSSDWLKVSP